MPPAVVSSSPRGHVPWKRHAGVLFLYLAIAAVFTWPLVRDMGARLGGDAGDPSLVASILWRNAWMLPISPGLRPMPTK